LKISRRILPVVTGLFVLCFLDRVNLSYAALEMNRDLGLSPSVYGLGAGLFFLGYLVFEIPAARLVEKQGARLWLGVMLIAWGFAASLMGAVRGSGGFFSLRILLGVAEAGFFPGIIIYLSRWFSRKDRARAVGALAAGLPAANLIGAPVSGWLLRQHWLNLPGWRWLFMVEGLPSVLAGLAVLRWLTERPRDARWLDPGEREWIESVLEAERIEHPIGSRHGSRNGRGILAVLAAIWFLDNMGVYGFNLWLPTMIKRASGFSSVAAVSMAALPFAGALAAAILISLSSDRSGERRWHAALPMATFGIGLALSVIFEQSLWIAGGMICIAALGLTSGTPAFWALATAAEGGANSTRVAIITSAGALGGFCGPYVMGYLRAATNGFSAGLILLAASTLIAGTLLVSRIQVPRQVFSDRDDLAP
jgi:ACS family tartrate transporter-like MFS transporter